MADEQVDNWAERALADLDRWADGHEGGIDTYGIRLLLELVRQEPELSEPQELDPPRLRRLMLETFVETVVTEAEDLPSIMASAGALVDFLAGTGRIPAGRAAELHAELKALEPELAEILTELDEAEQESVQELVQGMMLADGIDLDDEAAVQRWLTDFESLSEAERFARAGAYLQASEEMRVPPVVLAPPAELAAAARRCAAAAPGDGDDEAVLASWLQSFDRAVTGGFAGGDEAAAQVRAELTGVLLHLYEQDEPAAPRELAQALTEHLRQVAAAPAPEEVAAALDRELQELQRWGAVETTAEGGVALTPLGVWGVRELLLAEGFIAPVVGELADRPAAALVEGLAWHGPEELALEVERWLSARPPESAAAELVEVMRFGSPSARGIAAAVLGGLDASAAPVVREALEDPATRPYARLWLHERGDAAAEPAREDLVWMLTDTVAAMLETADPAEAVAEAVDTLPPGAGLRELIDGMAGIGHPQAAEVLDALAAHLADPVLAEAARAEAARAGAR